MISPELYRNELLQNIIPFWENHSIDHKNGGYYTCLDAKGNVFDHDKFIWLQGRQVWTFSMLYNYVDQNDSWLKIAKHGLDFLIAHGRDTNGDFYFSTTEDGQPLVKAYNIFSDCFAVMAFSQYYKATGEERIRELAIHTYRRILERKENPKGIYNKRTENRKLINFSLPMILSNLVLEMEDLLDSEEVDQTIGHCVDQVMNLFRDDKSGLIFENVLSDGSHHDSFDGRLINPGHGLEAMWFMLDIGARNNDIELINKACKSVTAILEYGWDQKYGGLFYFMDCKNHPPQQLEWDQKLWWMHLEALVALVKAYDLTGQNEFYDWFVKVHDYTWSHFSDPKGGEWYGYLNRQGDTLLNLKGGKWKGCFHVPRALYLCWKTLESIDRKVS